MIIVEAVGQVGESLVVGSSVPFVGIGRPEPSLIPQGIDQLAVHPDRKSLVNVVSPQRPQGTSDRGPAHNLKR